MKFMNVLKLIALTAMSMSLLACTGDKETAMSNQRAVSNAWAMQSYFDDQADGGLIRESSLYPSHFVPGSHRLNELGEHDVRVLAHHFRENNGSLNLRKGEESSDVYAARVRTVRDFFASRGVEVGRIEIVDGFAGGDGLPANRVAFIVEQRIKELENVSDQEGFSVSE